MSIPFYTVDSFTSTPFSGNPAAVCVLSRWLDDATLLNITKEINLSETAFIVKQDDGDCDYHLRWFTPAVEVDLCGHATLAAAKVIFEYILPQATAVHFASQSGALGVLKMAHQLVLDFPSRSPQPVSRPRGVVEAMGKDPVAILKGERDYLLVYDKAQDVIDLSPDFKALKKCGLYGYIATASGSSYPGEYDFISRGFFPAYDIDEDPVTGSAHCVSGPFWGKQLGKDKLHARQISERGGDLWLSLEGERIKIAGEAVIISRGELLVS